MVDYPNSTRAKKCGARCSLSPHACLIPPSSRLLSVGCGGNSRTPRRGHGYPPGLACGDGLERRIQPSCAREGSGCYTPLTCSGLRARRDRTFLVLFAGVVGHMPAAKFEGGGGGATGASFTSATRKRKGKKGIVTAAAQLSVRWWAAVPTRCSRLPCECLGVRQFGGCVCVFLPRRDGIPLRLCRQGND